MQFIRKLTILSGIVFLYSCGDMFARKVHLTSKYSLIESETKGDFGIYFKTEDGDFIGRIPKGILGYAIVRDSLLFAVAKKNQDTVYYILNARMDDSYAETKDAMIGPISKTAFDTLWKVRYSFEFKNVPN